MPIKVEHGGPDAFAERATFYFTYFRGDKLAGLIDVVCSGSDIMLAGDLISKINKSRFTDE